MYIDWPGNEQEDQEMDNMMRDKAEQEMQINPIIPATPNKPKPEAGYYKTGANINGADCDDVYMIAPSVSTDPYRDGWYLFTAATPEIAEYIVKILNKHSNIEDLPLYY